jgi:hypothetical protein
MPDMANYLAKAILCDHDTEVGCPVCNSECDLCLAGYPPPYPWTGHRPLGVLIGGVLRDGSTFLGYVCDVHKFAIQRCQYAFPGRRPWPQLDEEVYNYFPVSAHTSSVNVKTPACARFVLLAIRNKR